MIRRLIAFGFAILIGSVTALSLPGQGRAGADVKLVHTYRNATAHEVSNVIAVSILKLLPLLPPGYVPVPASALGFGGPDQGIVAIANFRGFKPTVDGRSTGRRTQVAIDLGIVVVEPPEAAATGTNIPGAVHLYALSIYTDDLRYALSLKSADMPVTYLPEIGYGREIDDATGIGDLTVIVPSLRSPFYSKNSAQGYVPMPGAFNAVFWHDGKKGRTVLHFRDEPFRQGVALSRIFAKPNGPLDALIRGGGLGPCASDPHIGFRCLSVPSLNLRWDGGTVGRLMLVR